MRGRIHIADAVNRDHPLNSGLVSWWLALPDQQRGNVFRDVMRRNPVALTNGPLWSGVSRPGGWGSIVFDGSDDRAEGATTGMVIADYTLSCWIYPETLSGFRRLISATTQEFSLMLSGTKLSAQVDNTGHFTNTTTALSLNTWQHVAATFNSATDTVKFYINATKDATEGTNTGSVGAITTVTLGAITGGASQFFDGLMDDARIYDRVLSDDEIAHLMRDSRLGYQNELNWSRPLTFFDLGGGAPPATNRRRRVLICGAAA